MFSWSSSWYFTILLIPSTSHTKQSGATENKPGRSVSSWCWSFQRLWFFLSSKDPGGQSKPLRYIYNIWYVTIACTFRTELGFLKSVIKTQLLLLSKINDNNFFILGIFQELDIHSTDYWILTALLVCVSKESCYCYCYLLQFYMEHSHHLSATKAQQF